DHATHQFWNTETMRILITAGPTREYIDPIRYISNASSGRMGFAVAQAAVNAGHDVTLISGPVSLLTPPGVTRASFVTVDELQSAVDEHFDSCDVLIMAAAVGDFTVANPLPQKLSRKNGPITLKLKPTSDILAAVAAGKTPTQTIVAFAVKDGSREEIETKARAEQISKNADFTVANTIDAMGKDQSLACIIEANREEPAVKWAHRPKTELAQKIVELLEARVR
ncbi:unnamed protein product, partial [marine sediment metagenome]